MQTKAKLAEKVATIEKVAKFQKNVEGASISLPVPESDASPASPFEQAYKANSLGIEVQPGNVVTSRKVTARAEKQIFKEDESSEASIDSDIPELAAPLAEMGSPTQFSSGDIYLAQADTVSGSGAVTTDAANNIGAPSAAASGVSTTMSPGVMAGWAFVGVATSQVFAGSTDAGAAAAPTPVGFSLNGGIWLGKITNAADLVIEAFKVDGTKLAGTGTVNADGTFTIKVTENYTGPVLIRLKDTSATPNYKDEGTGQLQDLTTDLRAMVNVTGHGDVTIAITPLTELAVRELLGDAGGDGGSATTVLGQSVTTAQVTAANDAVKTAFHLPGDILTTAPVTVDDTAFVNSTTTAAQKAYGQALAAISGLEAVQSATTGEVLSALAQGLVGTQLTQMTVDLLISGAQKVDTAPGAVVTTTASALASAIGTGITGIHISSDTGVSADDFITQTAAQDVTAKLTQTLGSSRLWASVNGGGTWTDLSTFVSGLDLAWTGVTLAGTSSLKFAFTPDTVVDSASVLKSAVGTVAMQPYSVDTTAPVFSAAQPAPYAENSSAVAYTASATDANGFSYSLGGTDAALFALNAGVVTFKTPPNFEDTAHSTAYSLNIIATDLAGNVTTKPITVNVNDVNEAPSLSVGGSESLFENSFGPISIHATSTDPDSGTTFTYAIAGGADRALFSIDSTNGDLSFIAPPNFEAPAHAGNQYNVSVAVSDGALASVGQNIVITVNDVNEAPTSTVVAAPFVVINKVYNFSLASNFTDVDAGDKLTYTTNSILPQGLTLSANGVISGTVTNTGVSLIRVSATDSANHTTFQDFDLTAVAQPSIISISTTNGPVKQGDALTFTVNLTEAVTVTGNPTLVLDANGQAVTATYVAGSGTPTLTFNATAPLGDASSVSIASIGLTNATAIGVNTLQDLLTSLVGQPTPLLIDNSNPVHGAGTQPAFDENTSGTAYAAAATDATVITYSLGGSDFSYFDISKAGVVTFKSAPDFESATHSSSYNIDVIATDALGHAAAKAVVISVLNVNEAPSLTVSAAVQFAENATAAVVAAVGSDPEHDTLSYTLGGVDKALFSVDSQGVIHFVQAPDFEMSAHPDHVYNITVSASDGSFTTSPQPVAITVSDVNEIPTSTNIIPTDVVAVVVDQNYSFNVASHFSDQDAADAQLEFSATGLFDGLSIDVLTGEIKGLVSTPNTNGVTVTVTATDSAQQSTSQSFVLHAYEAPVVQSVNASVPTAESGNFVTFTLVLSEAVSIDSTFGTPTITLDVGGQSLVAHFVGSAGANLDFVAEVGLGDDASITLKDMSLKGATVVGDITHQALIIGSLGQTVTGFAIDNTAPQFTSGSTANFLENDTVAAYTSGVTDVTTVGYTLGGADLALLSIDKDTGVVTFKNGAPDFESPLDQGGDNVYNFTVTATDKMLHPTVQNVALTVKNVDETPAFDQVPTTIHVPENTSTAVFTAHATDPEKATLVYGVTGADAARFHIDTGTGALSFVPAPDFETPTDANIDKTYVVSVTATDGTNTASQALQITVDNVNEAPVLTSGATVNVDENTKAAYTVQAADVDSVHTSTTLIYGMGGADVALFDIDTSTGAITFKVAPDFESTQDVNHNHVYNITVTASDASLTSVAKAVAITVVDVNETPALTNPNLSASAAEGTSGAVFTATASDPDAGTQFTYILGGNDANLFAINAASGAISFLATPDFETKKDFDNNNVYDLTLSVSDGKITTAPQALTIEVTNVNEAPVVTSGTAVSVNENTTAAYTVLASDVDANTSLSYAIVGGADATLFTIDGTTGAILFKSAPDYESAQDAAHTHVYNIQVTASDGALTSNQNVAITVDNVNENPTLVLPIPTEYAVVGQDFSQDLSQYFKDPDSGDVLTFASTTLPGGLTLDSTGLLHGKATGVSSQTVTVTATDSHGLTVDSNVFTISEVIAPTLSSQIDGVTNLEVTSSIVLTASENVLAGAGKYIHLINDGGAGFHGENIANSQDILVTDTTHVHIVGDTISIDPGWDLDFNNNYHIEIDAGAFVAAGSGQASVAVTDPTAMNFSTVNPTALGISGTGVASASSAMVGYTDVTQPGTDAVVAGHNWLDAEGAGNIYLAPVAVNFASGNMAIVASDPAVASDPGIATNDFYVAINDFGTGDLIYFDNHGDNTIHRQDNFDGGMIVNYGQAPTLLQTPPNSLTGGQGGGQFDIYLAPTASINATDSFNGTTALKVLLGGVTYEPILYG